MASVCLLALAEQLEVVGVGYTHQLQKGRWGGEGKKGSGKMPPPCMPMGFSDAAGEYPVCIQALAQVGHGRMP